MAAFKYSFTLSYFAPDSVLFTIESVAKLYNENKITLKQAKAQLEKSEIDEFKNKIMKMRIFQKKVNV